VGRRAAGALSCLGCAKDVAVDAKRSAAAPGELPHSKFRFDFAQFVIFVTFGGSVGAVVYSLGASNTFLSADDLTSDDLVASTGASSADVFLFLLQKAWVVELWHYPVAMLFGVLGCGLALLGEIVGAVLQTLGLRLLCWLDHTRLNFWWTSKTSLLRYRLLSLCTARPICDEVASLGALLQPILGGLLIGLWAVLQPFCLGEGTDFLRYLLAGTNNRTLAPSTLVGIGVVKLLATRTALSFGFVGGKFFPTMFLGGCVGCAIFLWCNEDSTLIIHRCSMPLVFPLTCLMANSVTSLGALFLSLPLCVILIFGLDGEQSSCVLLSCLTAYVLLHGIGRGLLPMVFERQVLAQLRLLRENNAALVRASVSGRLPLGVLAGLPDEGATAPTGRLTAGAPPRAGGLQEELLPSRSPDASMQEPDMAPRSGLGAAAEALYVNPLTSPERYGGHGRAQADGLPTGTPNTILSPGWVSVD
jgi:hypothetical protein